MPRKKGARINSAQDVTIHDYANSEKPAGRPRKSAPIPDSRDRLHPEEEVDAEDGHDSPPPPATRALRARAAAAGGAGADEPAGNEYPEIVYYLISKYVRPEDVGRFAGINRGAYAASEREGFWRRLYARHCAHAPLPASLRVEHRYRLYGLRQRVVRALHRTYPPFLLKTMRREGAECEPRALVGRCCVNLWYTRAADHYHYYFKLRSGGAPAARRAPLLRLLDDIRANPEEHSRVLLVKCRQFCALPPVMGMQLCSASTQLAQGFRHHRLQLGFTRALHASHARHLAPDHTLLLDSVKGMQVMDWWHPHYPPFDAALPPAAAPSESEEDADSRPTFLAHDFLS